MKRTLFNLSLICLIIGLSSTAAYAEEVFSVTAGVKDLGIEVLKQEVSQVREGFILVPEPSSILLLGSGVLALFRYRLKRNRKNDD